jgi:hypothetical protein
VKAKARIAPILLLLVLSLSTWLVVFRPFDFRTLSATSLALSKRPEMDFATVSGLHIGRRLPPGPTEPASKIRPSADEFFPLS